MTIMGFNKRLTLLLLSSFFLFACGGGGGGGSTPDIPAPPPFTMTFSNSSHVTDEDQSITASFNISTSSSSSITYSTITASQYGNVSYSSSNNSFTYTPNANYFGTDSFVVSASAQGITKQATISLTINSINDVPVLSLTQPVNNEGDNLYPLIFTDAENKLDINLSFSDEETALDDLIVIASTSDGASIPLSYAEGSDISTLDLSEINAGPTEINISIDDSEAVVSDSIQVWVTKYIDDPLSSTEGNKVYTIYGNHSIEERASNYVIISDAFPDDERKIGLRKGVKQLIDLMKLTDISPFMDSFFSIGVIETPLSNESALGITTGCDSRDENIFCLSAETQAAVNTLQNQYFSNVSTRSLVTGLSGRGVSYSWLSLDVQNLTDTTDVDVRNLVRTMKHEFGHSYIDLADEYTTTEVNCTDWNCGVIETGPNTTAEDEPEKVRWNHHIEDLTNIPGYHDTTTVEGIGYFEGVYYGLNNGFRPSYSSIMNGFPTDYVYDGILNEDVLYDKIGIESFLIRTLIFQGLHSINFAFNEDGNIEVSHNFNDPSGLFEVEWYLNGEAVEHSSNTYILPRKTSGYEHVSYRIKEKTQNILTDTDNILNFRDVYDGLFASDRSIYTCQGIGIGLYTTNSDYEFPQCRNTIDIKFTCCDGLFDFFAYETVDDLISSRENEIYGLQYWIEHSGYGAMFGINWEAN